MPNVELLKQTLAHIETHPDQWDQSSWISECGTAYCFAGWAAVLSGAEFADDGTEDVCAPHSTMTEHVEVYATRVLGLENADYVSNDGGPDYGIELFDADNSLPDLRRIVGELCADEVTDHG